MGSRMAGIRPGFGGIKIELAAADKKEHDPTDVRQRGASAG